MLIWQILSAIDILNFYLDLRYDIRKNTTDVYSHILDDDRRKNAELFEEAFYEKKNLNPQMHVQQEKNDSATTEDIDPELLAKVLANPEMRALLNSLAKTMK